MVSKDDLILGAAVGVILVGGYLIYVYDKSNLLNRNRMELDAGLYINPLKHIYMFDQFSKGEMRGWAKFQGSDETPYIGTMPSPSGPQGQGGITGDKVLVIPHNGTGQFGASDCIKRSSWIWKNKVRWESWIDWRNFDRASNFNWFSFNIDTQIGVSPTEDRRGYSIRWLKDIGDSFSGRWQYDAGLERGSLWTDLPGDPIQELTCNCSGYIPISCTKGCINQKYDWLYTRMDIDLGKRKYVEFQCADRIWKMNIEAKKRPPTREEAMLNNLINYGFGVRSRVAGSTSYLWVDTTCISAQDDNWLENLFG